MKRHILFILCALMLGGVAPHRVWADRQVYDTPGDGRPSVGDDDEPFVTAPRAPVAQAPQTPRPISRRHAPAESWLRWFDHGAERARTVLIAWRDRILIFTDDRTQR